MAPIITFIIFVAIAVGYFYLMKNQGRLKEKEQLIYKESKVYCTLKSPVARKHYKRDIEITDRRVIEKIMDYVCKL